jgi:hypothetical protein
VFSLTFDLPRYYCKRQILDSRIDRETEGEGEGCTRPTVVLTQLAYQNPPAGGGGGGGAAAGAGPAGSRPAPTVPPMTKPLSLSSLSFIAGGMLGALTFQEEFVL